MLASAHRRMGRCRGLPFQPLQLCLTGRKDMGALYRASYPHGPMQAFLYNMVFPHIGLCTHTHTHTHTSVMMP